MPGVDLDLDLPSLSDTLSTIVSKTAVALAAIEDDLAGMVVPSEMDINTELPLGGNALTEVGSVQLVAGNAPSSAGSIYYASGEFFVRDSTGLIQLTAAGALNTASVGGIVGDYGGANPARVTYNDASGEYRFTEDTGVWADLVADDVVLQGSAGSVRFGVDSAITTARQFLVKTLPSSGTSLLVYNAATSTLEDGAVTVISGTPTFSTDIKHSFLRVRRVPLHNGYISAGSATVVLQAVTTGATATWQQTCGLNKGDRPQSVKLHLGKTTAGTTTVTLYRVLHNTFTLIQAFTLATSGADQTLTCTISSPVALSSEEDLLIEIGLIASGDTILQASVSWDRQ